MCVRRQNFTTLNLFVSFLFYSVFIFYLMIQTCTSAYGYLHLTQGVDVTACLFIEWSVNFSLQVMYIGR